MYFLSIIKQIILVYCYEPYEDKQFFLIKFDKTLYLFFNNYKYYQIYFMYIFCLVYSKNIVLSIILEFFNNSQF